MNTEEKILDAFEDSLESERWPWWGKMAFLALLVVFVVPASCVVLTSFDDAEQDAQEARKIEAHSAKEQEETRAKLELEKARLETLERLIKDGMGPVAARCAVEGWGSITQDACQMAEAINAATKK